MSEPVPFPIGGGEMGNLIRNHDWESTALGSPAFWPELLKSITRVCLDSGLPMAVWWGPDLLQVYNDDFAAILGAQKHPLALGSPARETWPGFTPLAHQVLADGKPVKAAGLRLVSSPGESTGEGFFTVHFSPVRGLAGDADGILTTAYDTTAQVLCERNLRESRRAEQNLAESEARYRALFHSVDEGFCILEMLFDDEGRPEDYRFLEINPTFERQTGLVGAVGRTARELLPNLEYRWIEHYGNVALTGTPLRFVDHSDVMGRWFDVYAFRFGGVESRKVVLIFSDITRRKKAEQEREYLIRELERSNAELSRFAHAVSHDLQAPVRTVNSLAQMLRRGKAQPQDQERLLAMISQAADGMGQLIEALLGYAQAGQSQIRRESVDVNSIVQTAIAALQLAIVESGAKIACDPLPVIEADKVQLQQLFQNLLANAVKYRRPGEQLFISISWQAVEGGWQFAVQDSGEGVDPAYHGRIFEPLERLHGTDVPGTGMGLALCRQIVERHGGRIWVESKGKGRGSTFHFIIRSTEQPPRQEG